MSTTALTKLCYFLCTYNVHVCFFTFCLLSHGRKEEVEKFKQKDLLEEMLGEMTGDFPALSKVFVSERDTYLSQSLKACSMTQPQGDDGKVLFCLCLCLFVCFIGEMTGDFPALSKVFVSERDIYLSVSQGLFESMIQSQSDEG